MLWKNHWKHTENNGCSITPRNKQKQGVLLFKGAGFHLREPAFIWRNRGFGWPGPTFKHVPLLNLRGSYGICIRFMGNSLFFQCFLTFLPSGHPRKKKWKPKKKKSKNLDFLFCSFFSLTANTKQKHVKTPHIQMFVLSFWSFNWFFQGWPGMKKCRKTMKNHWFHDVPLQNVDNHWFYYAFAQEKIPTCTKASLRLGRQICWKLFKTVYRGCLNSSTGFHFWKFVS